MNNFKEQQGSEYSSPKQGENKSASKSNALEIPQINLPKGGGAIKSIDEKFSVNASNGTSSFNIPIPLSKGRNNFTPDLNVSYNSGTGNSILGIGWSLNINSIQRKTDKMLPLYDDEEDTFVFSGAEDLVPFFKWEDDEWKPEETEINQFKIKQYRPRIEGSFSRIEKISHPLHGTYWRVTTSDNKTTFYGPSTAGRISDCNNPENIFQWLPEISFDDKGNCMVYEYRNENLDNVANEIFEKNRINGTACFTNKYLKRVKYGNRNPYYVDSDNPYFPVPVTGDFLFEAVLDFGEHDQDHPEPTETLGQQWTSRADAFSTYRSGFDIRTYRLLKRILMFHRFDELIDGDPYLVSSVDFEYETSTPGSIQQSELTYLKSLTIAGYILKPDGNYSKKTLPSMEFSYEPLNWKNEIKEVDPDSIINLPEGLNGNYQWTDFYGEGISGIFTEQGEGWFYKSNLGDIEEDGKVSFDNMSKVMIKPSFTGMNGGILQLKDLNTDGGKQIVINTNGVNGFFELSDDYQWLPFKQFENITNINLRDPNLKMIDLDGDGQADILISEDNVFTWYPSKGRAGYDVSRKTFKSFDDERGPAIVFSDALQTIYISDMSGDGLADIVRIRNGEICYWPNLGYGIFGAKITMANAPVFDSPDLFNSDYLQLSDISGTGTTDILYLGSNKCRAYLNLSGNSWSDEYEINPFFSREQPNKISVIDLLGNGTSCLVWSSSLPENSSSPMRYIDLMGGKKPHLLTKYINNLGKETTLSYKSSTWFYLKDKAENKPWVTKLPFPVHCVRKSETVDRITGSRYISEYKFHHGYYDHQEREFRGFGMVEQTDTEDFEHWIKGNSTNIVESTLHQPPVLTKTWFHTGALIDKDKILTQFSHEYWYEEMNLHGFAVTANEASLEDARVVPADSLDPNLIQQLNFDEWREAFRACKSMLLRKEVFALDAPKTGATQEQIKKQLSPYTVSTHNCFVEILQRRVSGKYAVFTAKESEAITYNYERNTDDPRIVHSLNIKIDKLGNILESASVVYNRQTADMSLPLNIRNKQNTVLITYTLNNFTGDVKNSADYRLRTISETKTYEIKGLSKTSPLYIISDFDNILTMAVEIPYHETDSVPPSGTVYQRVIEHVRNLFLKDDLTGPLPLHSMESRGISYENYQLAYTPVLLNDIYGIKVNDPLMNEGKFIHSEGDLNWWIRSGSIQYLDMGETINDASNRFYIPVSYTDPFGTITKVRYFSNYSLFVQEIEDALNSVSRVETFDLRTLSPKRIKDINDNFSEIVLDELGQVKAMAVFGKGNEADDLTGLTDYTAPAEQITIDDFLSSSTSTDLIIFGKDLLKHATTRFVYDIHRYKNSGGTTPTAAATIVREQHFVQNNDSPVQLNFEYTGGIGKVVMKKIQAEPGIAKKVIVNPNNTYSVQNIDTSALIPEQLRWVGNGRTVYNNKGNAVKKYEPYFSATHKYEDLKELVETGVTPVLYYDPLNRLMKTDFPDGTFAKTEFDSWKETVYDQNDTVIDSTWYNNRLNHLIDSELIAEGKDPGKEKEAAERAAKHYNTPLTKHFDTLGRTILEVHNNGKDTFNNDILFLTHSDIDIEGNTRTITDSRNSIVMRYKYDMLGNKVYQLSMDAGERWMLQNVLDSPLRTWDSRNHELSFEYDILHRPILKRVIGGDGVTPLDNVYEKLIYGEGMTNDKMLNLRGKTAIVYDTAGKIESSQFDFKGNLLSSIRKYATDYKNPVDWSGINLDAKLEIESFTTVNSYDGLSRIISKTTPDNSIFLPEYNEANMLEIVRVTQNAGTEFFVKNIDYNEKGQRNKITYGNDITTNYFYDTQTFRLIRLEAKKANNDPLQDLYYTYDPAGNTTHVEDKNIPVVFFDNQKIAGVSSYKYDPLYRLTEASGREHIAQVTFGNEDNTDDLPFLKKYSQNDPMAWRNYTEQYRYDDAGNILQMRHIAQNGNWTRDYNNAVNNNRLLSTVIGPDTYNYSYHPQHGFITSMPHLQVMRWNFKDELQAAAKQAVVSGTPETTYYVYDGGGQRVRKITERQAGAGVPNPPKKNERIYVDGVEFYREYDNANTLELERLTLHVMDDKRRIAMIETRTQGDDGTPQRLVRYQFSNHLGSACIETDNTARVISYEEYHPYGTTSYQAVDKDIKAAYKRYRYTGMERDDESGLNYHSARYYIPWLGRWLNPDPIGISGGMNLYAYSMNNPIMKTDTSGTNGEEEDDAGASTGYRPNISLGNFQLQLDPQIQAQMMSMGIIPGVPLPSSPPPSGSGGGFNFTPTPIFPTFQPSWLPSQPLAPTASPAPTVPPPPSGSGGSSSDPFGYGLKVMAAWRLETNVPEVPGYPVVGTENIGPAIGQAWGLVFDRNPELKEEGKRLGLSQLERNWGLIPVVGLGGIGLLAGTALTGNWDPTTTALGIVPTFFPGATVAGENLMGQYTAPPSYLMLMRSILPASIPIGNFAIGTTDTTPIGTQSPDTPVLALPLNLSFTFQRDPTSAILPSVTVTGLVDWRYNPATEDFSARFMSGAGVTFFRTNVAGQVLSVDAGPNLQLLYFNNNWLLAPGGAAQITLSTP